jgi:hypothetical protein
MKPIIAIGSFPYIIIGKKFPILKSGRWLPSYISVKIPTNFLESTQLFIPQIFQFVVALIQSTHRWGMSYHLKQNKLVCEFVFEDVFQFIKFCVKIQSWLNSWGSRQWNWRTVQYSCCHCWVSPLLKRRPVQCSCCHCWVIARCWRGGQCNDVVRAGLARCGIGGHDAGLATCGMGGKCKLSDTTGSARERVRRPKKCSSWYHCVSRSGMEECQLKLAGLRIEFPWGGMGELTFMLDIYITKLFIPQEFELVIAFIQSTHSWGMS